LPFLKRKTKPFFKIRAFGGVLRGIHGSKPSVQETLLSKAEYELTGEMKFKFWG